VEAPGVGDACTVAPPEGETDSTTFPGDLGASEALPDSPSIRARIGCINDPGLTSVTGHEEDRPKDEPERMLR
jgi:hypothetical protein